MQLSMIFFTIVIERKRRTPEEEMASLHCEQVMNQLNDRLVADLHCYPSYCTRI